jgi:hypothetical protein
VSLPFDATLKNLVQDYLPDFEQSLDLGEFAPLALLNVDLSTLSAATDIALGHGQPPDRVVDLNFQSGPDEDLAARVLMYNAVLHYRLRVPVHSVVLLLRPAADHRTLTGRLHYESKKRKGRMTFTYEVIRLWRQPAERFLDGGMGTLPLAPLCQLPASGSLSERLTPIIQRIDERLTREAVPEVRAQLLAATFVLSGLRVGRDELGQLFAGVKNMRESSGYQIILDEGRTEALQQTLMRLGRKRFGRASKAIETAIKGINDLKRLENLTERLLDVAGWKELLDLS